MVQHVDRTRAKSRGGGTRGVEPRAERNVLLRSQHVPSNPPQSKAVGNQKRVDAELDVDGHPG